LKYLHENGCPWNETSCEYASRFDINDWNFIFGS